MSRHLSREELEAGLPEISRSPKDRGTLEMIVARTGPGERQVLESCEITLKGGVPGDHWAKGCWMETDAGEPHPDVQICIMNSRTIALVAQNRKNWPAAGDNFFVDLDLSPENLSVGQRLQIGTATLEITAVPHLGCASFVERYGRPATQFVNGRVGRSLRLRGVYARVMVDGVVSAGDEVSKVEE